VGSILEVYFLQSKEFNILDVCFVFTRSLFFKGNFGRTWILYLFYCEVQSVCTWKFTIYICKICRDNIGGQTSVHNLLIRFFTGVHGRSSHQLYCEARLFFPVNSPRRLFCQQVHIALVRKFTYSLCENLVLSCQEV
jgi:hypothetical protein